MELLTKLGIDWKLLIAQMVNFLVLLAVLYKFLYKPLVAFLDARTNKISDSLKKAKEIEVSLKNTQAKVEEMISTAKKEAAKVLAEAQSKSEKIHQEKLAQTTAEAKTIVDRAKTAIQTEKEAMVGQAKTELAELVVKATGKILENTLTKEVDEKLVEKILKGVK